VTRSRIIGWIAGGLVCLAVIVGHARFALVDGRPPVDLNLSYQHVPDLLDALSSPVRVGEVLVTVVTRVAGWYDLALALALRLFGRSVFVAHGFNILAVACVMVCGWLTCRRLFGGPAGAGAAALLGNASGLIMMGRVGWIHVPELALLALAVAALVHDPGLRRWRTAAMVGLCGAGALAIRPTGLIWVGTLAPLLLWTLWGSPSRLRQGLRLAAIAATWGLGVVPTALELRVYLSRKIGMRERYAAIDDTPGLYDQLTGSFCLPVGWGSVVLTALALVGLVALAVRPRREGLRFVILFAVWAVAPLGLQFLFVVSPVDFPVAVFGVAVLGAGGLGRIHRLAPAALVVLWVPIYLSQWLPPPSDEALARLQAEIAAEEVEDGEPPELFPGPPVSLFTGLTHPADHYRPYRYLHFREILERVDATCGTDPRRRCVIEVYHGLFHPVGEASGQFCLIVTGREHVEVVPFWSHRARGRRPQPDAYVRYVCDDLESHWNERFPDLPEREALMLSRGDLRTTWERELPWGCRFAWMTPVRR